MLHFTVIIGRIIVPDTIGKNIECQYNDGQRSEPIGQATITATTGDH